jgi:hypothetical protein
MKIKVSSQLMISEGTSRWVCLWYCEFIIICGVPNFVDFMDSIKPRSQQFNEYLSLYIHVLNTAGDTLIYISMNIKFLLKPRKLEFMKLNDFTVRNYQIIGLWLITIIFFLW